MTCFQSKEVCLYILCFVFLVFSCKHKEVGEREGKTVFRYNESAGISSLDPSFARNVENIWAINQLFNGLVQMNDKLEVEPCIGRSWEISMDGLTYTFHLRDDVYFHDHELFEGGKGRKVVASDFVYSFYRIVDPEVASPGAWIFNNIDKPDDQGFKAVNDSTFQIHLLKPFPPFLGLLTMQYCSVVPKEIVKYYGRDFRNNPVGTGPFIFKMWKEGVKLIFVKNENYFEKDEEGNALPYLDAVSISFLSEIQVVFLEFVKGDLDFLSGLDEIPKDEVLSQTGDLKPIYQNRFRLYLQPYLKTDYIGILVDQKLEVVQNSPLKIKAVRQAINYGIDRKTMVTYLMNNIGTPANSGIVPLGLPSYNAENVKGYYYHPDRARKLLIDAGFPNGEGLQEITLVTSSDFLDMCEFIQHQLSNIGIKIKIDVNKPVNLRDMVAKSTVNMFRKNWIADYADAENYLAMFYSKNFSPSGPNYTHFKNDRFDELYEKSQLEINDTLRYEYYRQMDQIVMDEAPVVVLFYDQVLRLVQNNITGLGSNPMNLLTLKRVKKVVD
ncbi:MAG: ABC transporter substrate-binding protein [Bacteroidota bacterium]